MSTGAPAKALHLVFLARRQVYLTRESGYLNADIPESFTVLQKVREAGFMSRIRLPDGYRYTKDPCR